MRIIHISRHFVENSRNLFGRIFVTFLSSSLAYFVMISTFFFLTFFVDVLLAVHFSIIISVINQLDAQSFCFTTSLFHASTCFKRMCSSSRGQNCITQPLLSSHWNKCDDTRGCVKQFLRPYDEHMCLKYVEAWNKLIVNKNFVHWVGKLWDKWFLFPPFNWNRLIDYTEIWFDHSANGSQRLLLSTTIQIDIFPSTSRNDVCVGHTERACLICGHNKNGGW